MHWLKSLQSRQRLIFNVTVAIYQTLTHKERKKAQENLQINHLSTLDIFLDAKFYLVNARSNLWPNVTQPNAVVCQPDFEKSAL